MTRLPIGSKSDPNSWTMRDPQGEKVKLGSPSRSSNSRYFIIDVFFLFLNLVLKNPDLDGRGTLTKDFDPKSRGLEVTLI